MLRSILLFSLLASPAMAFEASNGLLVIGNSDQIEVQPSPGQGASQSWCAAGEFAIRALGQPGTTPVYRVSPPPRRKGEAVSFSLSPAGASDRTGLLQLGAQDNTISAAHAQSLCRVER